MTEEQKEQTELTIEEQSEQVVETAEDATEVQQPDQEDLEVEKTVDEQEAVVDVDADLEDDDTSEEVAEDATETEDVDENVEDVEVEVIEEDNNETAEEPEALADNDEAGEEEVEEPVVDSGDEGEETGEDESGDEQDEVQESNDSDQQDGEEVKAEDSAKDEQQERADSEEEETIVEADDENDNDFEPTMESVIEALLFASDEPLSGVRLAKIMEIGIKELKGHVKELNKKYKANDNSFRIEQIAGGLQMMTLPPYSHWLRKLIRVRGDSKLSPAALETLAIVAYKQPIIRADVETIRGVAAGEMIRSLMFKGLVKIAGRAEILGRPMLYGTTKKFLEIFGLNSLKDLPKIEELKKPKEL